MYSFVILLIVFTTNVMSWEGYHTEFDDGLPTISPKNCGLSRRTCDPNSTHDDPFVNSRIWDGEFADEGEYPFFLYLGQETVNEKNGKLHLGFSFCGAAILNEWWVLTAAHCVLYREWNTNSTRFVPNFVLMANARNDLHNTYRYEVEKVVVHKNHLNLGDMMFRFVERREDIYRQFKQWEMDGKPMHTFPDWDNFNDELVVNTWMKTVYGANAMNWDIALMKTRQRIVPIFNETHYIVNSICLPKYGTLNFRTNETMVIMGFGMKGHGQGVSDRLKVGVTQMISQESWAKLLENEWNAYSYYTYMICAKRLEKANSSLQRATTCPGDSGSPTIQYIGCKAVLVEVAKHGTGYKDLSLTDMMTWRRLSLFVSWIRFIIEHQNLPANHVTYGKSYGSESLSDDYPVSKPLILFTNLFVLSGVVLILIAVWLLAIVLINSKNH